MNPPKGKPAASCNRHKTIGLFTLSSLLLACSNNEPPLVPPALKLDPQLRTLNQPREKTQSDNAGTLKIGKTPTAPSAERSSTVRPATTPASPASETADITLMFDQIPLTTFIQVAFGSILKASFSIDPTLTGRTDLVTIRTGAPQTRSQIFETVKMLLKSYGIAVMDMGGFYRIVPDNSVGAYSPEIKRGRAQPEVPLPLRPIFQLVELAAVRNSDVSVTLRAMFGQKLTIQDDPTRNALLISGQASDITAALEAIQVLDQPVMKGRISRRITPSFLPIEELSRKLADILTTEGYNVATAPHASSAITILSVPSANSLLLFAADEKVIAHTLDWAKNLDNPQEAGKTNGGYFTYPVKYADAQDLAKTLQELLSSAAAAGAGSGTPAKRPSKIVVNATTNSLIFVSSPDEYTQLRHLLKELDKPAKSALIEVTVAEVRLTDKQQLGIEWDMNAASHGAGTVIGGTLGGLGIGTGGLTVKYLNSSGQTQAVLNALASNNRANILSSPRIMTRNGEMATIQVGQEVPIVTSQQSNSNTNQSTGGILQTIQYRNTGVILKVKPIIHAGGRVELDVAQEVSAAQETKTGVTSSPTISSRKVETKLSIRDGSTVLLGGLISQNDSKGDSGVPYLKDIPLVGQLFRANTDNQDKTEMLVLITPYVIEDDTMAEQVTQSFRSQLGAWARPAAPYIPTDAAAQAQNNAASSAPTADTPAAQDVPATSPGTDTDTTLPQPEAPAAAPSAAPEAPAAASPGTPVQDAKLLKELQEAASRPQPATAPGKKK